MIYVVVEDAAAWHEHAARALSLGDFPSARVKPLQLEPYAALVTYLWDPSGVLIHLAQSVKA